MRREDMRIGDWYQCMYHHPKYSRKRSGKAKLVEFAKGPSENRHKMQLATGEFVYATSVNIYQQTEPLVGDMPEVAEEQWELKIRDLKAEAIGEDLRGVLALLRGLGIDATPQSDGLLIDPLEALKLEVVLAECYLNSMEAV